MPLINGCKYSCEPCIRGHRATSCAHNDRVLVEVRKPGRPLQSCGHRLDTCVCGKLNEYFKIGDVLPNSSDRRPSHDLQPSVAGSAQNLPISPVRQFKQRSRRNSSTNVSNKPKKRLVSPMSEEADPTEPETLYEDEEEASHAQTLHPTPKPSSSYMSPTDFSISAGLSRPVMAPNSPSPGFQNIIQYQDDPYGERSWNSQYSSPLHRQPNQILGYSSRIEDISLVSSGSSTSTHPAALKPQRLVRSQYIMATRDPMGRSANEKR